MSAAGEKLRAERKRFERELASPEVIPNTPIGVDDRAHFLADSPAAQPYRPDAHGVGLLDPASQ